MVGGLILGDESLIADDGDLFEGFFNRPLADVGESLSADGGLFGCLGWRPAFLPVTGELFEEWGLDGGGLVGTSQGQSKSLMWAGQWRTAGKCSGTYSPRCSAIGANGDVEPRTQLLVCS